MLLVGVDNLLYAQTATGNLNPAASGTRSLGISGTPWLVAHIDSIYWTALSPAITASSLGALTAETDPTIYTWAKASTKPSYSASEVGLGSVTNNAQWYSGNHPTTTTDYGLPSYPTTLPASDVYAWAKASVKPSYTYTEVGAAATSHVHAESDVTNLTTDLSSKIPYTDTTSGGARQWKTALKDSSISGIDVGYAETVVNNGGKRVKISNDSTLVVTKTFLTGQLAAKANTTHTHAESDVTNLTTDLAAKANKTDTTSLFYVWRLTCGQATFSTTLRRLAVSVPGTTTTSLFLVTPVSSTDVVPVAGDLMAVNAKTDSLIILRPASGTSAIKVNWWRLKL
jgi:hypothetical protein